MTTTQPQHTSPAENNATGHAKTIEALYELSCWDFSTGEAPQALTGAAAQILDDLSVSNYGSYAGAMQEAITEYAQEMPLTVLVRSDWHFPDSKMEIAEFEILLSTGGPACRIIGQLDRGSVAWQAGCRPILQHQDWFTPWVESNYAIDTNALLWFCEQFYYGE